MLEKLKELTQLVNSLGRSSGKGPLKRALQQVRLVWQRWKKPAFIDDEDH